jgi:PAS domain S-box-containing protein
LTDRLLELMAERRRSGKQVLVLADMRRITGSDSSARLESKWFLEEADWDVLGIIGNRYLQPLIFFVLRDFKRGNKLIKYFTDETRAVKWMLDPVADTNFNRLKPHNRLRWAILALMLLISAGTVSSWVQAKQRLEIEAEHRFDSVVAGATEAIDNRLQVYTAALYGFRGLYHASDTVNQLEYNDYFASLDLLQNYPGINSVNFVSRVTNADMAAFVEMVRSDRSLNPAGNPDFAVTALSSGSEHFIVTYVGAEGQGSNPGTDQAGDADRIPTLLAARDSGEPTATATLHLFEADGRVGETQGFLITIPIYQDNVPTSLAERRIKHEGFVNAVFDYQKLFTQAFGNEIPADVAIKVVDSAGKTIYQRNHVTGRTVVSTKHITTAGQKWTMELRASDLFGVSRTEAALPLYVAALGVTLVTLLASVLWLQGRSRKRAVELASEMTEDIKQERNSAIATKNKDEAILSSIGDGVLVLDNEGKIVRLNRAGELITGFASRQAVGKHYKEVLSFTNDKDGRPADDFISKALSGQVAEMAAHTMLKRRDGRLLPVADSAAPVMSADGKVMGAVVVFRDTTRERQLENMKDELLSVASHELRTPMGAVRANVSMILSGDYGPVNDGLVEPLTDIKASTVRLVELVNSLLSAARLDAGRMKFSLGDVEIQALVKEVVASLAPLGKEKGLDVTFKPGAEATVQADADKVKQVLTNLIGNSLKFTEKGGITIATDTDDQKVEITVTDTGLGISPEDQKKLFGKFQQITSVQEGKPVGTGLGLYISRQMIHKMGGDLWIKYSEPTKGSVFVFSLPRPSAPEAQQARQAVTWEAEQHPDQK